MMPPASDPSPKVIHLYFDDSGSRLPDAPPSGRSDGIDGFAFGGVLVFDEDLGVIYDRHTAFMERWGIDGPLHSTKIRGSRAPFRWPTEEQKKQFLGELEKFLCDLPLVGIACAIHRPGYNARYAHLHGENRWKMCKTAAAILVERSAKFADRQGRKLEIVFEECGRKEDRDTINYIRSLKKEGMPFNPGSSNGYDSLAANDFSRIILGDARRVTKKSAIVQIADMYLYPMMKGGYDPAYRPYKALLDAGRIVDATLSVDERPKLGIKYSCFDS